MTDIKQQIATQLQAYSSLDALKTAVREWVITSDGSLDALTAVLSTHHNESYNLSADDWQQLYEQGLTFNNEDETREEDMGRLQRYRETGYGIPHEQVAAWLDSVGTDRELPCPE
ncbi:hypothetical protein DSM106972_086870 [Dulcicalothrix desertica PCC 7102]|uniref:Uncharacterized protein n=1 Tax=Dulcicalothrix desertica PCC 7102 TaxID=232991 RepID=A0A433US40_9CYAN|nr:hypothetical protein [Dulcicalothrix desertica]RUS96664.1 hypothetical protein DSM106972_086870 [Dulcicalothrix desertica PCC 7102]TWH54864.1 hypothetical protein CAL7102_02939 [Dulcicalothrix desertica PCC 7102]